MPEDLVVGGRREVVVPQADRVERLRSRQAHELVVHRMDLDADPPSAFPPEELAGFRPLRKKTGLLRRVAA